MIDLSTHLGSALPMDGSVRVGGGATVGTALDALAPSGRVIPVGVARLPGMGMVTRGGIGYLTRSLGLTMDHLVEVDMVLPSGDIVHLSEDSTGEEAELWWAVRGCAPCFGVVTGAVLRTHEQGPVFVDRVVVDMDALPAYFAVAPELPRHTTMSAVLGRVPGDDREDPVLFLYSACRSQAEADIATARSATTAVAAASPAGPRYRSEMSGRYLKGLPQFAIPGPAGEEPAPITLPPPGADRGWFLGKAPFAGPTLGPKVAAVLDDAIRSAPTTSCRIDFQHTGGALAVQGARRGRGRPGGRRRQFGRGRPRRGSHLFILYWGMLSFITPPVALAAVAAAGIARSKPMQTGLTAMRLGAINFVLPFMFVLNPALILDAPLVEIVPACITAVIAVWLMAAGFEGWLYGVGRIGWFERAPLLVAALGLLQPGLYTDGFGALVLAGIYGWHFLVRRPRQRRPA